MLRSSTDTGSMDALSIALLQLPAVADQPEANLRSGLEACRSAAGLDADIAVFPELWQLGYAPCPAAGPARRTWLDRAIDLDDPWLDAYRRLAGELDMAMVVTFLQRWPGGPRNAATLIGRDGRVALTYAKVHTCDFAFEAILTPGDEFPVATLDTRRGAARVGIMICYDREFPEAARELMLGGAEIILTPNACELPDERIGQFRTRAFENMVAVAMANYPDARCHGRSCAFDGVGFAADGSPRDHQLVQAGEEPGVVLAHVDLDLLRHCRRTQARGDAYRKPHTYARLARAATPEPPFDRPDARRGIGRRHP